MKWGFFLIKNPEKICWGMTSFNRIAGSVLLAALFFGVSNLAETISESWRTLLKWAQPKYAKKGQKKLAREQSSPSTRASRRLGSGLLPNGRSSPKLAITPSPV
jgi:hypothetical protein